MVKLRVLMAGPFPPPTFGGIRAMLQTLLSSKLPELVVFNPFNIGEPPGYIPGRVPPRRFLTLLRQMSAFRRKIGIFQPHVVHIHMPGGSGLVKALLFLFIIRKHRVVTVSHLHFWPDSLCPYNIKSIEGIMINAIARSDAVITVSKEMHNYLCLHLPENKTLKFMPNCVRMDNIPQKSTSVTNNHIIKLLFLSNVERRKGIFELIQAFAHSKSRNKARLVVIGGDSGTGELNSVRDLAVTLKIAEQCHFLGPVYGAEKFRILADSDIYLLPSYAEGQPIAIIEAMAAGLPIIATRVGGIPDLLKERENGFLVEPGDIPALSKAIDELVDDASLRKTMGVKSRQLSRQFDAEPYVKNLICLYENIADID